MTGMQSSKHRLVCITLANKDKVLEEFDVGQSCLAAAKIYSLAKSTFLHCLKRNAEIFEAFEGKTYL